MKAWPRPLVAATLLMCSQGVQADWLSWWLTPDQQGERLMQQGEYAQAAKHFSTPQRMATAFFMAGDFVSAAAVFGRVPGPIGAYNRGNAQVMLGDYAAAAESYERAIALRPDWSEAIENRDLALARLALLAPPKDDAGGTGGMLEADEIVLDSSGRVANSENAEVIEAAEQNLNDEGMRSLWLRRVETRPGDFLAAKFNAQLINQETQP
jgi:Ca-activated chloride channel family protein